MRKTAIKRKLAAVLIALIIVVAALSGWYSLAGQVLAADSSVKLTYVSPSKIYSDSSKSKSKTEKSSKKTTKSKNKSKAESNSDSSNRAPGQPPSDGQGGGQPPSGGGGGANTQSYDYIWN
ncbi:hypothetical protein [Mogibacterium timidum]|uniref:hypothetical protein n=1 Tax=Mogibacterium timidum TaxID=35519 RepID=UPI002354997B|nr:hypothetical protein [Mogibacterium timidum]